MTMKKLMALFVSLGIVLAVPALVSAAEQEVSLWERLRKKIELITPKKKLSTSTTAAGGVRGSLADADDVYWKGEAQASVVEEEELTAFRKAIELVDAGKAEEAKAAFAEFVKQHPDSTLRADAEAALAQLAPAK
jgi:TolA-binding protein